MKMRFKRKPYLYCLSLMICFKYGLSQWWIYSTVLSEGKYTKKESERTCNRYNLNEDQYNACLQEPRILLYIGKGTNDGLTECQRQFHKERWNCSKSSFNNKFYKKRTPETAFVNAISSAGVIHKVAQECDLGVLENCNCQSIGHHGKKINVENPKKWYFWSQCNNHIKYGMKTTKIFLDPSKDETYVTKTKRSLKKLIVLQNNKAARKIIYELSRSHKKCSCHGPTGQCISRTCYRWLPKLPTIARELYNKYRNAIKVKLKNKKRLTSAEPRKILKKTDLVYTERLNYCKTEVGLGIPGPRGRLCSNHEPKSGDDMTSCEVLCCGRGYNPSTREVQVRCRCKFIWCCEVQCELCLATITEYRCK